MNSRSSGNESLEDVPEPMLLALLTAAGEVTIKTLKSGKEEKEE